MTNHDVDDPDASQTDPIEDDAPRRGRARLTTARLRNAGGIDDNVPLISASALGGDVDRLAPFSSAILAIRWATTMVCLALAYPSFADNDLAVVIATVVVLTYTALRTVSPIRYLGDTASLLAVLGEVALFTLAVAASGFWSSPLVVSLVSAVMVAGFARGFGFAIRIGAVAALAIGLPDTQRPEYAFQTDGAIALQWTVILLMVGLIAGYARRISGEADRQHTLALDRLGRLADANALLFSLHRVAQTLPASLDYDEVLDSTVQRLRGLIDFDALAILLADDTDDTWSVARREGLRLKEHLSSDDLPPVLRSVTERPELVIQNELVPSSPGLAPSMGSGIYAPLIARSSLIGLLVLEHRSDQHFTRRDVELVNGFVEPVALAIDNARWFGRLRTVGADEERTRIARELHDRIGQSLAYLAFELDRIVSANDKGNDVAPSLLQLREDVRGVIGEVRDTLYDLRTDVSEVQDMADTLDQFIQRVIDRTGLDITLYADRGERLPILQEREMWRIAQEALANVEKHAKATRVRVLWRCNGSAAALEVADDGQGFPVGTAGRLDSYGIMGMRERAASIGATLDVLSEPGKGTRVRCYLAQS
ncbi:MAG: GAF domain-containing sensor histidine kinase [Acidimicrobiales bacterium]|nr:GAF domain-containing sensor histidine kinase [Acidimicrobiales bacterium]